MTEPKVRDFEYGKDKRAVTVGNKLYERRMERYGNQAIPHSNAILGCHSCPRAGKAGLPVPPMGPIDARYMVTGACPGRQEVEDGLPFNPKAPGGNYLTNYLKVLGWDRTNTYITNCCFCLDYYPNTVKDRLPTEDESRICSAWKIYEFKFQNKVRFNILLGKNAVQQAFGRSFPSPSISEGYVVPAMIEDRIVYNLIVHHPGYLLRRPSLWDTTKISLDYFRLFIERKEG